MREYQQKYILRKLFYSRVTIVALFLLIVLLLRSIMELNDKRIDANTLRDEARTEKNDLTKKVEKAQSENDAIATPRGFEAYVRATYPVVKDGEGVVVIYDNEKTSVTKVRTDMTVWERLSIFWKKITK